jgi:hypothetical protein
MPSSVVPYGTLRQARDHANHALSGEFRVENGVGPDLVDIDMRQAIGARAYSRDMRASVAARHFERDILMRREARPREFDLDNPDAAVFTERPDAQVKFDFADH